MSQCGVHPGSGAVDDPIEHGDALDIPVFVKHSTPMVPQRRPSKVEVTTAYRPLPAIGIPANGRYLVRTSWRAVLQAAITVGRDVSPWLVQVPQLAGHEILSRCAPLRAYLRRQPAGTRGGLTRYELVPNEVYLHGTEITAKSAFSYRLGMTMAEWLCWGQLGMGHSSHAESVVPPDVIPKLWQSWPGKPDLVGRHRLPPESWVIEAKAQRRLGREALRKGAAQLDLGGLIQGPHRRVLCGTSLEDRVFMTLDMETYLPNGDQPSTPGHTDPLAGPDIDEDDAALYQLARASMLSYLVLRQTLDVAVVPVGYTVDRRAARPPDGSGPVLLEMDDSTAELRQRLRQTADHRAVRRYEGIDMLTASVPGSGMTVGLSRRLYAACTSVLESQMLLALQAQDAARTESNLFANRVAVSEQDDVDLAGLVFARNEWQARADLMDDARTAYRAAADQDWESLIYRQPRLAVDGPERQLEAATADTYLAIDPTFVP